MPNYAQLHRNANGDSYVLAVTATTGIVDNSNMIEINECDGSLLGCLYQDGKFISMEHFASLDADSIVTEIVTHPSNAPVPRNFQGMVKVDRHEAYSLIGCKYVDGEFIRADPQKEQLDKIQAMLEQLLGRQA